MNRRSVLLGTAVVPVIGLGAQPAYGATTAGSADALYVEKVNDAQVRIWLHTPGHRWIRYTLRRYTTVAKRLDAWRIDMIHAVSVPTDAPESGFAYTELQLTTPGNYEYAFQLHNGTTHFGGSHGNEKLSGYLLMVDGRSVPVSQLAMIGPCARFELAQDTVMFDPDIATETPIVDMHSRHVFTPSGLDVRWDLEWLAGRTVKAAYGAMLPAIRDPQVTTRFRYVDRAVDYDIGATDHNAPPRDSYGVEMYNTTNGLSLAVEIEPEFFDEYRSSAGHGIWVYDGAAYNKVYPSRVYPTTTADVSPDHEWHLSARYRAHFRE